MRIINIIDNFTKVNFGIWNAAISTASILKKRYQIASELWYPAIAETPELIDVDKVPLQDVSAGAIDAIIQERQLTPDNCIIVTHGCWQYPTRWGAAFKKLGYKWLYVPHGMLEPWSLQQKKLKKAIYFQLIEHRLSKNADKVRAVGLPEYNNLIKKYKHTVLIPNGIEINETTNVASKWNNTQVVNYLFMARLHHKKGIVPLVKAWLESPQGRSDNAHLYIAGPDDGELTAIEVLRNNIINNNITITGPVYNEAKQALLKKCHIYLLPSYSEGFPTSVLEAMNNDLVPVITDGCNFPEAIEGNYAIKTTPIVKDILQSLHTINHMPLKKLSSKAHAAAQFTQKNYSIEQIAKQQSTLFQSLLK